MLCVLWRQLSELLYLRQGSDIFKTSNDTMLPPGRPLPQGDSQYGSPGLDDFQRAKSVGLRFSLVSKLDSPSAASNADPTAHGLSLP